METVIYIGVMKCAILFWGANIMKKIVFAGGCFWGVEEYFRLLSGVIDTKVGYANGNFVNPTYEEVCTSSTGFSEACLIKFDEKVISLKQLLDAFWKIVDPTALNRQGNDIGSQYRTGIYYESLGSDGLNLGVSLDSGGSGYWDHSGGLNLGGSRDSSGILLDSDLNHLCELYDPLNNGNNLNNGVPLPSDYLSNDLQIINQSIAKEQKKYSTPIITEVDILKNFYYADNYHQKYLQKNPHGYCHISSKLFNR